jgi:hypothetical protein
MSGLIDWESFNVTVRSEAHARIATFWESVASWTRMTVSLTAGVSAISIFADNTVVAATFVVITALVTALNAGFSPSELAKKHRDASRGYGHLERPLADLAWALESSAETVYVPVTGHDQGAEYDAGYYTTDWSLSAEERDSIWREFVGMRERIEALNESAPPLSTDRWKRVAKDMEGDWQRGYQQTAASDATRPVLQPGAGGGGARGED